MDSVMLVGTVTILVLTYREIKKRLKSEELYFLAIAMGFSLIFIIASSTGASIAICCCVRSRSSAAASCCAASRCCSSRGSRYAR